MTRAVQVFFLVLAGALAVAAMYWINPPAGKPNLTTASFFAFFTLFAAWMPLELENDKRNRAERETSKGALS